MGLLRALAPMLLIARWAAATSWTATVSPMPTARAAARAVVVNGRLYVIGGRTAGGVLTGATEVYDPRADVWTSLPPMPTPRSEFCIAAVGGWIYTIGGEGSSPDARREKVVEILDTDSGRWRRGPDLPRPRDAAAGVALDGAVYVLGGEEEMAGRPVDVGYVLEARAERWSELPAMMLGRDNPRAAAFFGRIWVVGGTIRGVRQRFTGESFDPERNSWRAEAGLPWDGVGGLAAAGGSLYAFGGGDGRKNDYDSMAVLQRGWWRAAPSMPTGRSSFASASDGSLIFVAGGSPGSNIVLDTLEIFDTTTQAWRSSRRGAPPQPPTAPPPPEQSAPTAARDEVALPPPPTATPRENDYALVIGLDDYRSVMAAEFGHSDAEAFARYATARLGVPRANVITLAGQRATRTDIVKYVEEWLPRNADKSSRVYVFYSGHGAPDPEKGDSYLLPWDGDPMFLQSTGYPLTRLYDKLAALPAEHVIVFLDSCFSGAGGRSVIAKNLRPLVHVPATPLPRRGKLTVLTASGASQVAGGFEAKRHGLFTYYLLKGLGGEAARSEHLDVSSLYEFVRANVRKQAHRENREQDPQLQTVEPGLRLY